MDILDFILGDSSESESEHEPASAVSSGNTGSSSMVHVAQQLQRCGSAAQSTRPARTEGDGGGRAATCSAQTKGGGGGSAADTSSTNEGRRQCRRHVQHERRAAAATEQARVQHERRVAAASAQRQRPNGICNDNGRRWRVGTVPAARGLHPAHANSSSRSGCPPASATGGTLARRRAPGAHDNPGQLRIAAHGHHHIPCDRSNAAPRACAASLVAPSDLASPGVGNCGSMAPDSPAVARLSPALPSGGAASALAAVPAPPPGRNDARIGDVSFDLSKTGAAPSGPLSKNQRSRARRKANKTRGKLEKEAAQQAKHDQRVIAEENFRLSVQRTRQAELMAGVAASRAAAAEARATQRETDTHLIWVASEKARLEDRANATRVRERLNRAEAELNQEAHALSVVDERLCREAEALRRRTYEVDATRRGLEREQNRIKSLREDERRQYQVHIKKASRACRHTAQHARQLAAKLLEETARAGEYLQQLEDYRNSPSDQTWDAAASASASIELEEVEATPLAVGALVVVVDGTNRTGTIDASRGNGLWSVRCDNGGARPICKLFRSDILVHAYDHEPVPPKNTIEEDTGEPEPAVTAATSYGMHGSENPFQIPRDHVSSGVERRARSRIVEAHMKEVRVKQKGRTAEELTEELMGQVNATCDKGSLFSCFTGSLTRNAMHPSKKSHEVAYAAGQWDSSVQYSKPWKTWNARKNGSICDIMLQQEFLILVEVPPYKWHTEVAEGACCLRTSPHMQRCASVVKKDILHAFQQEMHVVLLPYTGKRDSIGEHFPVYRNDLVLNAGVAPGKDLISDTTMKLFASHLATMHTDPLRGTHMVQVHFHSCQTVGIDPNGWNYCGACFSSLKNYLRGPMAEAIVALGRLMKLGDGTRHGKARGRSHFFALDLVLPLEDMDGIVDGLVDGIYALPEGISAALSAPLEGNDPCVRGYSGHMDQNNDSHGDGFDRTGVISYTGMFDGVLRRLSMIGYTRFAVGTFYRRTSSMRAPCTDAPVPAAQTTHERRSNKEKKRRNGTKRKQMAEVEEEEDAVVATTAVRGAGGGDATCSHELDATVHHEPVEASLHHVVGDVVEVLWTDGWAKGRIVEVLPEEVYRVSYIREGGGEDIETAPISSSMYHIRKCR